MDIFSTGHDGSPNFSSVAKKALSYLRELTGFGLWMVTRVEGDDWIVLQAEDYRYGVAPSALFRWTDSFCSRMVLGQGPRVAPNSNAVPVYASAPIGSQVRIGAYIGVPLVNHDGTLFGTLCAIDPLPRPESIKVHLPLIELIADMLSAVLSAEIEGLQFSRLAELAMDDAETDSLTRLPNRRGWDRVLLLEEERCQRYGHAASVIAVDLDDLKKVNDTLGHAFGDELIIRAGRTLRDAVRKSDLVARVGGDEFLVLAADCDASVAKSMVRQIRLRLDEAGVNAALGMSKRLTGSGLFEAVHEADRRMYADKRQRKKAA